MPIRAYFDRYKDRPMVRPWALSGPVLILLICLPMLRPLRHPDPGQVSDGEMARLATVQAIVEQHTLAIEKTSYAQTQDRIRREGHDYSAEPPVQSALLAGVYWVLRRLGFSFRHDRAVVEYILTLVGSTLPVAISAGLVYRLGRMFELRREWRAALGMAVVFGSGLVSYGVVLNGQAPAAALLLAAATSLAHMAIVERPLYNGAWLMWAGFLAAMASVVDLSASVFLLLLMFVILAMRWNMSMRIGGILLYLAGAVWPVLLHAVLCVPVTGDLLPGRMHPEMAAATAPPVTMLLGPSAGPHGPPSETGAMTSGDDEDADTLWTTIGQGLGRILAALMGDHGLFSHFPALALGLIGAATVLHRHWVRTTKALALVTLAGGTILILARSLAGGESTPAMFGAPGLVIFLPLLLFWTGAWLRKTHRPLSWTLAGIAMASSVTVSLIGTVNPFPRQGYSDYTAGEALRQMIHPPPPPLVGGAWSQKRSQKR